MTALRAAEVKAAASLPLTNRELEIALLAGRGLRTVDIARLLYVSSRTVDTHLSHIYAKTGARNRVQLLNWLTDNAAALAEQVAPADDSAPVV
jgi:DNA-binding CsgD family transcriptional regulator